MAKILDSTLDSIQTVVECLLKGGVVILPTNTNYNILCDPFNVVAVKRLFDAKKRTKFGPLTLYLPSKESITEYTLPTPGFDEKIAHMLWPGEVSFILNKRGNISDAVTCGSATVAVTLHSRPILQKVIDLFGRPLSGSSANLSGQGDIFVTAEKATADLGETVDFIVNDGATKAAAHPSIHKSNSIIDFSFQPPFLVRKGLVSIPKLQEVIPDLITDPALYKVKLKKRLEENEFLSKSQY